MNTTIRTGESYITIFYRVVVPGVTDLVVSVTPLEPPTAERVIGFLSEEYIMLSPIVPRGRVAFFLRNIFLSPDYVAQQTGLSGDALDLLAFLLPKLTGMSAADLIAEQADVWSETRG